jgi:hypothetical protein
MRYDVLWAWGLGQPRHWHRVHRKSSGTHSFELLLEQPRQDPLPERRHYIPSHNNCSHSKYWHSNFAGDNNVAPRRRCRL